MSELKITVENATETYRNGDAKIKAAVRKFAQSALMSAVASGDLATAQSWVAVQSGLVTEKATPAPLPPAEVIARRAATLRYAADMLLSGQSTPDGLELPESFAYDLIIEAYDALDWSDVRDDATKLAGAKITRSVELHDISAYMVRAFEGMPVDTFLTVAQIITRGAESDNDYRPSPGAITQRLKGGSKGCTVPGITGDTGSNGVYGGRKIS